MGVLQDKRHIFERPKSDDNITWKGHWKIDTVHVVRYGYCNLTIVERKTKFTIIGKLKSRSTTEISKKVYQLINKVTQPFRTITSDNGT